MPGGGAGLLVLRPLVAADEDAAEAAHRELAREDFQFLLERDTVDSFREYLELRAKRAAGDLPEGWVQDVLLVAEADGTLVGRTSVRFELNDKLRLHGGHVGYAVRPEFRRRGHATEILRQSLQLLARRGLTSALVTCDDDNVASIRTIERCGGVLQDVVGVPDHAVGVRRYRVPTGTGRS